MAFSFNLCATAFVGYVFLDPSTTLQGKASPEFIAHAIANWERLPEKRINVTFLRNDLDMLARFNRRAIEQCYQLGGLWSYRAARERQKSASRWFGADGRCKKWRVSSSVGRVVERDLRP